MDTKGFLIHAQLETEVLETWVAAGWISTRPDDEAQRFSEIDVARAQLIRELAQDLGVNEEGIGIILNLLDQIHGLRCALRDVVSAVNAQPEALRREVLARLRESGTGRMDPRESSPG
jgi:chaperone modulatory protein CbpM